MGTDMTQLSYTRGPQDNPLLAMTIGEAFDTTVRLHARREALVVRHQNLRYSWGELAEVVEDCARGLLALGLLPGDRVGIWAQAIEHVARSDASVDRHDEHETHRQPRIGGRDRRNSDDAGARGRTG